MFPNLLGQQAYHKLTDAQMGEVIGMTRQAYKQKLRTGKFTALECRKYCERFGKTFEYLFATE